MFVAVCFFFNRNAENCVTNKLQPNICVQASMFFCFCGLFETVTPRKACHQESSLRQTFRGTGFSDGHDDPQERTAFATRLVFL